MSWHAAEIDDKREEEKADDSYDLNTSEDKLGFTIDCNGEDVQAEHDDDNDGYPCSNLVRVSIATRRHVSTSLR